MIEIQGSAAAPAPYPYDMENPHVYRNAMGEYKTERQLAFIHSFLTKHESRVLDIGGGSGRLAIPLVACGQTVTVVDPSKDALDTLKRREPRLDVVHGDLMSFVDNRRFDAALLIDVLKYIVDVPLVEVFARVNTLLPVGGLFFISEINRKSWRSQLSEALGRRKIRYNLDSPKGYAAALTAAGFEVKSIVGFCWAPLPYNSDSEWVRRFESVEARFHLNRWVGQSPWLLIAARKVR